MKVKVINEGTVEGTTLVTTQPMTFYLGVDANTGIVCERGHELEGKCVKDVILVFPFSKGSTVGAYSIYSMKKNGVAPLAMITAKPDLIVAIGCILASIPYVVTPEIERFRSGQKIRINAEKGEISWLEG